MSKTALQVHHSNANGVFITVLTLTLICATVRSSMSATGGPILVTELPEQLPGTILKNQSSLESFIGLTGTTRKFHGFYNWLFQCNFH